MATKTKLISVLVLIVLGIGIYAISMGTGNEVSKENSNQVATSLIPALKPLAKGKMAAMRILDKPLDLNSISFVDKDNNPRTIADWNGRIVLLNLWATWCPPCRHEMPSLEDLEKQMGGADFEVVTVSIDLKTPDKPKAFFKEINLTELAFYWDGSVAIFNTLKKKNLAFGMPSTILIDRNGFAVGALNGPAEWNSDDAIALIKKSLNPEGL